MSQLHAKRWCCCRRCCCCYCSCCCCCYRDKGWRRLRPGHDSVYVTMGNTATRQWTNKGNHKMATATAAIAATSAAAATPTAAIVGNKRHVRVKGTPTQQHQQQDDGDNNMQHTGPHAHRRATGRCQLLLVACLPACCCLLWPWQLSL